MDAKNKEIKRINDLVEKTNIEEIDLNLDLLEADGFLNLKIPLSKAVLDKYNEDELEAEFRETFGCHITGTDLYYHVTTNFISINLESGEIWDFSGGSDVDVLEETRANTDLASREKLTEEEARTIVFDYLKGHGESLDNLYVCLVDDNNIVRKFIKE